MVKLERVAAGVKLSLLRSFWRSFALMPASRPRFVLLQRLLPAAVAKLALGAVPFRTTGGAGLESSAAIFSMRLI